MAHRYAVSVDTSAVPPPPDPPPTPEERIQLLERRVADLQKIVEGLLAEHRRWRQWVEGWPQ